MDTPRMTADEFDALEKGKLRSMSRKALDLARLMYVEGKKQTEAAAALEMSPQLARHHRMRIEAVLKDQPAGWVLLQEWMPPEMAVEVRRNVLEAQQNLNKEKKIVKRVK